MTQNTPRIFAPAPPRTHARRAWTPLHRAIFLGIFVAALLLSQTAKPVITGVVNGASFQPGMASGGWVSIFGTNLAPTSRMWRNDEFVNNKLPISLDGVSVTINGRACAVYYISPTQLNVQAPDDASLGTVMVVVTTAQGGSSNAFAAQLQRRAPALFAFDPENRKYVAAVHADGVYVAKSGLIPQASTRAARPGDVILLFGTCFGATDPAVPAGNIFAGAANLTATVTVRIGGVNAVVDFAGLSGAGLNQFNVRVPDIPDGDQAVELEIEGLHTQPGLYITVQRPPKPTIKYPGPTRAAALACPGASCLLSGAKVTASPGEQVDFWFAGTNLNAVTGIRFVPPEGIDVSIVETASDTVHAMLRISGSAALGKRLFYATTPFGESNQSSGPLNISTFRITNLRLSDITNPDRTLSFTVRADYTDPTGAVSAGTLRLHPTLLAGSTIIISTGRDINPDGRTPSATSGTFSFSHSYSDVRGTTGGIFVIDIAAADGRESDTLSVAF